MTALLGKPGSLGVLMDELMKAEDPGLNNVLPQGTKKLVVYRWRPRTIDPPCLYHMVGSAPFTQMDVGRWRDTINIILRVAIPLTNDAEDMEAIETYTDAVRLVLDPAIGKTGRPLNGAATWAERTDMRVHTVDDFDGITYLCSEFLLQFRLDRMIAT